MRIEKGLIYNIIKIAAPGSINMANFPFIINHDFKYSNNYNLSHIYRLYIKKLYEK